MKLCDLRFVSVAVVFAGAALLVPNSALADPYRSGGYGDAAQQAVDNARDDVSEVVRALRAEWRADPEVSDAFQTLRKARRAFEAERRRVVRQLDADNKKYRKLAEQAAAMKARLEQDRRDRQADRDTDDQALVEAESPEVDSAGMVPANLGPSDKTVPAGQPAKMTEEQLDRLLEKQNSVEPGFDPISQDQAEQAAEVLESKTKMKSMLDEAIYEDDDARAAREAYDAAVAALDEHQAQLKATILNDPEYKAAKDALDRAQQRAASYDGR